MLWLEILLLVGIIAYSAKLGGIGVGMAGAVGMIAATAVFGLKPGFIPVDVMLIIMTVILAISVMQRAGGLAFMVKCAEKLLRNNPKYINALAPAVCFMLTTLGGTGYMAMSVSLQAKLRVPRAPFLPLPQRCLQWSNRCMFLLLQYCLSSSRLVHSPPPSVRSSRVCRAKQNFLKTRSSWNG